MATLEQLKTRTLRRADMENSRFIGDESGDSELGQYINDSYGELYDLLVGKYENYYTTNSNVTVTSGNTANLPATFYKLIGVDRALNGSSDFYPIKSFDFLNRSTFSENDALVAGTYRIWHVPTRTVLTDEDDETNLPNADWEEFIVLSAAIKCLNKEETDSSALGAEKAGMERRLEAIAVHRDAGSSDKIVDVRKLGRRSVDIRYRLMGSTIMFSAYEPRIDSMRYSW